MSDCKTAPCKYRPRSKFVLIRQTERVMVNGVALPAMSKQNHKYTVIAVGPEVDDLAIGDSVLAVGTLGEDYLPLPRERDLFITKQENVLLVIDESM